MPAEQVVDLADPEQVLGRRLGQQRRGEGEHLAHLRLVAAQGAADRQAVDARPRRPPRADSRRRSSWTPPWTIPKTRLARAALLLVPGEAAVEPAMRALGRAGRVVAVGVKGRALVEGQGDVGAELRLHLHRDLGRDEQRATRPR